MMYALLGKIPGCVSCICVMYSLIIALIVHVLFQLRIPWRTITLYPFMLHSISMSLFASVIGPFGGFFASGFKRAFKIKVGAALYIHLPLRLRHRPLRRILRQRLQASLQNKGRCCPLYSCPFSPPSSALRRFLCQRLQASLQNKGKCCPLYSCFFASVIGPVGRFFASCFKRAFKIKVGAALYIHVPFRLRNRPLRRILRQWLQASLQNKGRCGPLYPPPFFASVIGPFGGFFTSGLKRAFKIKVGAALYIPVSSPW